MSQQIIDALKILVQTPDLSSKRYISEQYDSQVMNDTVQIKGDAAIVRVHDNKKKAIAISTDCTPRYVEADPFEGAKQAVCETYRNLSAVGAKPLAITNCLNFGNPQKPEIMGQIVRAVKGITAASEFLNYPVVSGNVSLYNETNGDAIQPTPAIGGVGLLKDLANRSSVNFKSENDEIFVIGETNGHIDCSLYQREVLGVEKQENPPHINLETEKKNSDFVRELIERSVVKSCHDISDGGLLFALFEMCYKDLSCEIEIDKVKNNSAISDIESLFSEDQARFVITVDPDFSDRLYRKAEESEINIVKIGKVVKGDIILNLKDQKLNINVNELKTLNEEFLYKKLT